MSERKANFCPRCGTQLVEQQRAGKLRPICPNCDHTVYFDPKVAVVAFVTRGEEVLLVKRALEPGKGKWALPAGFVDADEDPRRAVERETLEETGLVVITEHLLDVLHRPDADGLADIVIAYSVCVTGGTLQASDDAEETRWFSRHSLPEIALTTTSLLVQPWIKGSFDER
jgi:ADP-ribose pyrophosphatase YjhB (NUDIX family)